MKLTCCNLPQFIWKSICWVPNPNLVHALFQLLDINDFKVGGLVFFFVLGISGAKENTSQNSL